jgi:hypothetical protein
MEAIFDRVLRDWSSPRVDFGLLSEELARPDPFFRTYYYDCLPPLSPVPAEEEEERLEGKRRYFSALSRLRRFEVREGKLEYRGIDRESNRPIFERKRIYAHFTADLVQLAVKQSIHRAVLVTADNEFLPAVHLARNEGVLIHLYHGSGNAAPNRDLWEAADDRTEINAELLQRVAIYGSGSPFDGGLV